MALALAKPQEYPAMALEGPVLACLPALRQQGHKAGQAG